MRFKPESCRLIRIPPASAVLVLLDLLSILNDVGQDKKAVVHIHNGVLAVKKNSFESVLMRWMKLEPIIQSEVSQKEKHQYSILTHIYGI